VPLRSRKRACSAGAFRLYPSRSAQVTNDAVKIDAAVAAFHEPLVDRGSAGAAAVYERFVESGDGSVDLSGIIRYLRGA
jgi:hypothetical protein